MKILPAKNCQLPISIVDLWFYSLLYSLQYTHASQWASERERLEELKTTFSYSGGGGVLKTHFFSLKLNKFGLPVFKTVTINPKK